MHDCLCEKLEVAQGSKVWHDPMGGVFVACIHVWKSLGGAYELLVVHL